MERQTRSTPVAVRALASLCVAAALTGSSGVPAQEVAPATKVSYASAAAPASATLEAVFWRCDFAASTGGVVDFAGAAHCSIVTESLMQQQFSGDFDAMLQWWRQNKTARHRAIARSTAAGHPAH